jgi:glycosyltransferase involved in cell wall biosynthesis
MTSLSQRIKKPLVSIVVPVFNDEEYIARALQTAVSQSLKNIEIICVDDRSTDGTVKIIEKHIKKDSRIKLIRHKENASAFQARRTGIEAARADYILFLDGDDELHKDAAKLSYKQAVSSSSDIVGFGSRILRKNGSSSVEFERLIQPVHAKLLGTNIVAKLFEANVPAQGHMWRYLFARKLLLKAYGHFQEGQQIYRVNDLPISFLSAALAKKYTSIKDRLYIYHFYAGRSGGADFNLDKFKFYTQAIESVNLLGSIIQGKEFKTDAKNSYESARLSVISNILRQVENNLPAAYHKDAMKFLLTKITLGELTLSVANFIPEALHTVRDNLPVSKTRNASKNVAIYTNNLNTGGVQSVVVSQATYLQAAGFAVTIIVLTAKDIIFKIPPGIKIESVEMGSIYMRLQSFKSILQKNNIDTVIDHNILYNTSWPFFNLVAKDLHIKTLAWIHSFPLRPMTEGKTLGKFLNDNIGLIDDLVVLSKADVSYWKSLGHNSVYYLPNPPSPLLLEKTEATQPKSAPKKHLHIIWLGRLQQSTKKVYSVIDIAAELKKLTDHFTITVVGPGSHELTNSQAKERVGAKGLNEHIKIVGPKHGSKLVDELKKADIYLCTSIIEGYLLTLIEAQSYALPAVMYEIPWLATVENNDGVVQTPQNDPAIAAHALHTLFTDKKLYESASAASLKASKSYLSFDFSKLYTQLLNHTLPKEFSPDINVGHMGLFAKWTQIYFAELMDNSGSSNPLGVIKSKDDEIAALKNSRAMKIGNAIVKPLRKAKAAKQKLAKHLKIR